MDYILRKLMLYKSKYYLMGSNDAFGIIAFITAVTGIFVWMFSSIIILTIAQIVLIITAAVLPLIQDSPDLMEIFLNNFLLPATEWFRTNQILAIITAAAGTARLLFPEKDQHKLINIFFSSIHGHHPQMDSL